jgi:hypothetical protein
LLKHGLQFTLIFVESSLPPSHTVAARDHRQPADFPEQSIKFDFFINLKPPIRLACHPASGAVPSGQSNWMSTQGWIDFSIYQNQVPVVVVRTAPVAQIEFTEWTLDSLAWTIQ